MSHDHVCTYVRHIMICRSARLPANFSQRASELWSGIGKFYRNSPCFLQQHQQRLSHTLRSHHFEIWALLMCFWTSEKVRLCLCTAKWSRCTPRCFAVPLTAPRCLSRCDKTHFTSVTLVWARAVTTMISYGPWIVLDIIDILTLYTWVALYVPTLLWLVVTADFSCAAGLPETASGMNQRPPFQR